MLMSTVLTTLTTVLAIKHCPILHILATWVFKGSCEFKLDYDIVLYFQVRSLQGQ